MTTLPIGCREGLVKKGRLEGIHAIRFAPAGVVYYVLMIGDIVICLLDGVFVPSDR